ncbi:CaiB/BaiF CoA transferase family protein [Microbacterium ulmi]|uniref:CoA transferase n=1 Tax=Microbacterium ulmi TaxID=179095 RepID=A0A7Y2LZV4_9MICO|nr:CaiB/BaiF CoA-transferase family protein [Microbacterium ulmi]NII69950.1 crotonobetainyl-CoA:carnitine CoA-transferase CaiB-like acyl-CoA transferase [Microbacterium ulmi]NNH03869.1 CoA transferase [Microbacterium ulmi]
MATTANSQNTDRPIGPLAGIVVLDLTRVFSGPFAAQLLGDLGADVIKVERLGRGDESRDYGVDEGEVGPGAPFLAHNRNKRSIAIDAKSTEGRDVIRRLAARADILLHNFRVGVMERLGLSYEELSRENPGLIYASISGFGSKGRMARRAANDLSIQSFSGLLAITGEADGGPVRNPSSVADLTAGMYATVGVLAALHHRDVTGRGQQVATSMLGGQLNYINHFLTDYWLTGRLPGRWGTANRLGLPNEAFPTSDGWVCITSANDDMWHRCAAGLGIPEAGTDPRFATLKDRYANRTDLVELLRSTTVRFTSAEVLERMEKAGVPCVPVNDIPDIASDPILEEIDAYVDMPAPGGRVARLIQTPLEFSDTPVTARLAPPALAAHTDAVLAEAGYDEQAVQELRAVGAIA